MLSLILPKWQDWAKPSCIRYTMQLLTRLSMKKGEKKKTKEKSMSKPGCSGGSSGKEEIRTLD